MKRILSILFLLLHIFYQGGAKEPIANNRSLLWRISGNGLERPSYLFGTMHVICSDKYLWTPKMAASLDNSEVVCLEMNLADPTVMTTVASAMIDADGTTLDRYFTKEQNEKLRKYVKDSLEMDMSMLGHMKLVGLETMLSLNGGSTCKETVSYEEKIMALAIENNKEMAGLETPEEQVALLNKIPIDSMVQDILHIINGKKEEIGDYDQLVAAYTTQNLPVLYNIMKAEKSDAGDLSAFLDERNEKWISRMAKKMNKKTVFFAVGAGHLWGTKGLISLLRKAGYTVVPIK
jgi:uncharacterized protein YbaP (TraB family)